MDPLTITLFVVGFALLIAGAELLVRGASTLAAAAGISPLVIGLTIVAYGTSTPELAVSVKAGLAGQPDIALGNVVGSNIYNLLAILGISALVTPGGLTASPHLLYVDLPIMTAVAVACLPIFFTGHTIARWEGGVFLGYYVLYTLYLVLKNTDGVEWLPVFQSVLFLFLLPLTLLTLAVSATRAWRGRADSGKLHAAT